jgi:hypothetical protein
MTTSRPEDARPPGSIMVPGKRYGILRSEAGRAFYHRSVSPEARQRKRKARKQNRKSKRRNR